jgi:hypothetical protein
VAAFAFAQTVELDQTSGFGSGAQHHQGEQPSRYEKQHLPCIKNQEPRDLIVAELSFIVHFVAGLSPRFTYGNHAATLRCRLLPSARRLRRGRMAAVPTELQRSLRTNTPWRSWDYD